MAAECLAKAKELRALKDGLSTQPKRSRTELQEKDSQDSELLTDTLRLVLMKSIATETLMSSNALVIIVKAPDLQEEMKAATDTWFAHRPQRTEEQVARKEFPIHPLGEKVFFMHATVCQTLSTLAESKSDQKVIEAMQKLLEMKEADVVSSVSSVNPRHKTPKAGRPWVWELMMTPITMAAFREMWAVVVQAHASKAWPEIKVDLRRNTQTELEKKLWEKLKSRPMTRMAATGGG